jgi:hypothetical protein
VPDYYPAPQLVQPSIAVVAFALVEYEPAGHSWTVHEVLGPEPE